MRASADEDDGSLIWLNPEQSPADADVAGPVTWEGEDLCEDEEVAKPVSMEPESFPARPWLENLADRKRKARERNGFVFQREWL